MFGDMMGKLQEMKQQMDETKKRLETITVTGEADGIVVTSTGNQKIKDIKIPAHLLGDHEALQDLLLIATNRALEAAETVWKAEMKGAAGGMLPNMGL